MWSVQPFNVHRSDLLAAEPISIDVFKVGDPFKFDIFKFISDFDPPRNTLRVWESQHSDIEGCITVVSPKQLVPATPLTDPKVPVLALTDALDLTHVGVERLITHTKHSGLLYDCRNLRKPYLQCVLAASSLFAKGNKGFKSNLSSIFYLALMRNPVVQPGLKKEDYKKILEGDTTLTLALPAPTFAHPQKKRLLPLGDIDGDDGEPTPKRKPIGDVDRDVHSDGDQASRPSNDSSSSSSSDSSSESASIDGESESSAGSDRPDVPKTIEGQRCRVESHGADRGIRLSCPHHGPKCRKFRSLVHDRHRYGPRAASYFLGAWIQLGAIVPFEQHRKKECKPSHAQIKAYVQQL